MAGRSGKSSNRSSANVTTSSLDSLLSPSTIAALPELTSTDALQGYVLRDPASDLRKYHPQQLDRPPPSPFRSANGLTIGHRFPSLRIAIPDVVGVCVRRKIRREVLFALNRHNRRRGRGGGKRHRNQYTKIHC